jgi:hypothetical protein
MKKTPTHFNPVTSNKNKSLMSHLNVTLKHTMNKALTNLVTFVTFVTSIFKTLLLRACVCVYVCVCVYIKTFLNLTSLMSLMSQTL